MGWLQEKYTKTYFTGLNPDGSAAGYGVEGGYNGADSRLRDFDVATLDRVNFKEKNVFEIGFGRGESIKYVFDKGASSYVGVDFAEPAYEIAGEYLTAHNLEKARIFCGDALEYIRQNKKLMESKIDVLLLLNVVEHIPRYELFSLLSEVQGVLSDKAVVVVNTPVYQYDNDVLEYGIDERNYIDAIDHADFIEETNGMHCNKYSLRSLPEFMISCGYESITEYQIYSYSKTEKSHPNEAKHYSLAWQECYKAGYPLAETYIPDSLEYAYQRQDSVEQFTCAEGYLAGMNIIGTQAMIDNYYKDDVFPLYDKYVKSGKTVFDVGGYTGYCSLHFAKLVGSTGKVVSFEPNPYNLMRMKKMLSANPELSQNIFLYNTALGDTNDVTELLMSSNIDNGHSSTSQLAKGGGTAISQAELMEMGFYKEKVQIRTLDSFVKETGHVPDVIKIDIEGAEVVLLKGAMNTLKNHSPLVFVELHNVMSVYYSLKILSEVGYEVSLLSEEWGNRIQMLASQKSENTGKDIDEIVSQYTQEYATHRHKSYIENTEIYFTRRNNAIRTLEAESKSLADENRLLTKLLEEANKELEEANKKLGLKKITNVYSFLKRKLKVAKS